MNAPPTFQATDRKFGSVVGRSNRNVSGVFSDVVDPERNCHTFRIAGEVRVRLFLQSVRTVAKSMVAERFLAGTDETIRTAPDDGTSGWHFSDLQRCPT